VEFRILGPVDLYIDDRACDLGSPKERSVLAVLLYYLGRPVTADRLIAHLWGDDPPASALSALYGHVSRLRTSLRRATGDDRDWLARRSGYLLDVSEESVDYWRFRRLCDQARSAADHGDDKSVAELLREAEELWRGTPLADVGGAWADGIRISLEEDRFAVRIERIEAELRLGRHAGLVGEIRGLTTRHPLDERLARLLMLALDGCGRRAEALAAYLDFRQRLAAESGSEPGTELQQLHMRMLAEDPAPIVPRPRLPSRAPTPVAAQTDRPLNTMLRDNPDFTGRVAELDAIRCWLCPGNEQSAVSVVVIAGMAGVGKTALAVRAAHLHRDRYPDQFYFALRGNAPDGEPVAPISALGALLRMLGVPDALIPEGAEDRAALWRSLLMGRQALILLDDALDAAQVRPLLPGAPGCAVLVTTRRRTIDLPGMFWLPLASMRPPEAASLFTRTAGEGRSGDHASVASVLRLCGYLPLEIEIAACELRRHPAWDAGDLASRLREADMGDRRVARALELSYRHLTAAQQRLFRLLALHPAPGFSRHAAVATIEGQPLAETQRTLDVLLDHHLIEESAPDHYTFHDLVREYAHDLAETCDTAADRDRARRRLLDYYLWLVGEADRIVYPFHRRMDARLPRPPANLSLPGTRREVQQQVAAELPGLLSLARYATSYGRARHIGMLSQALARFLDTWGYWADAADLHSLAATAWRSAGNTRGQAQAQTDLSFIFQRLGRYDEALKCGSEALALARAAADRTAQAEALDRMGIALWRAARYREALAHYDESLSIWRALGDRDGEADALCHSALALWHVSRYAESFRRAEQALAIYRQIGDLHGEATALNNLADLLQEAGCPEQALTSYQQALDMFRDLGDRQGEAIAVHNIGITCGKAGRAEEALAHYRTALDIYRDLGDRRDEADALDNMGTAFQQLGHYSDALLHHQRALVLAHEIAERFLEARSCCGSGDAHLASRNYGAAADDYRTAIEVSRRIADRYQEAQALRGLGYVALHTDGEKTARTRWRKALRIFEAIGRPDEAAEVRALLRAP